MNPESDSFIPTRQSLLSRLRNWDDQESWRDFFETYGKLIYGLASKAGLSDAEAQDVVQETLISVARKMPQFKYDRALGSFKGWLLQITRRRIADQLRKRYALKQETDEARAQALVALPAAIDHQLASIWEEDWQRNLLEVALGRIKQQISARQYQMFDLYVNQDWPMDSIRQALDVSAAQVYMAKMRITRMIKREIKHLEMNGI